MGNDLIRKNYKDIADAIRAKTGENGLLSAEEMPDKINESLAKKPEGSLSITENGTNIDVSEKATVDVNVPGYPEPTGTKNIYSNGENIDVKNYAKVNVSVPPVVPQDLSNISPEAFEIETDNSGGEQKLYISFNKIRPIIDRDSGTITLPVDIPMESSENIYLPFNLSSGFPFEFSGTNVEFITSQYDDTDVPTEAELLDYFGESTFDINGHSCYDCYGNSLDQYITYSTILDS